MSRTTRRTFLGQLGSAATVSGLAGVSLGASPAAALAQGRGGAAPPVTGAIYDLLIQGGRVIDPAQNISAVRDVAIAGGRIVRVAENIPPAQARQVYDAKGKMVTPGLIDMHTHVYQYGIPLSVDSDIVGWQNGVTTVLDCGSTGASTFPGFRHYVIDSAKTRIYALLNISTIGLVVTNEIYLDPAMINARSAINVITNNRDRLMGVKIRIMGRHSDLDHDKEVLKTAVDVATATGLPIMMHWSDEPDLLNMLRKGDILAHPFNPPSANSSNLFGAGAEGQADKVLPQILALKDRGVYTDGQLATTHHSWAISEKAAAQNWWPDSISTDISRTPDGQPASVLVPMSEFLHLGMPLEKVIEGATATPAKIMNFPEKVGTLAPGTTADVAVLDLEQGSFEYNDGARQMRTLKQRFVATATIKGGIFLKGAPAPAAPAGRGGAGRG
ncbi:MAG TPA: amidohydrolase family protein [Vicinamibacterales bacterium]|jgi:dihydroorotase|nr:amidohydrolase family protein [Vicinamibacterales bacterium]